MGDNQRTRFRQQPFQVPKIGTVKSLSLDLIVSLLIAMYSTWGRLTTPSWSGRTLSSLAAAWCIKSLPEVHNWGMDNLVVNVMNLNFFLELRFNEFVVAKKILQYAR